MDEGAYTQEELNPLKNLVAAIFRLENARSSEDILDVVSNLIEWLTQPEQASIRRSFSIWINQVLKPPKNVVDNNADMNDLLEIRSMLKQSIPLWLEESQAKGEIKGQAIGEAKGKIKGEIKGEANILLKLLSLKFKPLPSWVEGKVRSADKAQIEGWAEKILVAETLEDLLTTK